MGPYQVAVLVLFVVGLGDVIALDKGLLRDLPVARHDSGDVDRLVPLVELEAIKMPRQDLQVVTERFAIRIEIDEHESTPQANSGLRQAELLLLHR